MRRGVWVILIVLMGVLYYVMFAPLAWLPSSLRAYTLVDSHAQVKQFCAKAGAQAEALRHANPGLKLNFNCGEFTIIGGERQTRREIPLTAAERKLWQSTRQNTDAVIDIQNATERVLLQAHGIKVYDYSDPCWRFVGMVLGTNDRIVEDVLDPAWNKEHNCAEER